MRVFVKANIYILFDKNLNHRGSFVKRSFTCEKYSLETCFFPSPALIPAADAAFVQISFFNRKRLRKNYERFANKVFHMVQQHSNENCRTQVDQKYFLSTCLSAISIDCTGC